METLLSLLDRQGPSLHALLTRLTFREDVAEDLMQDLFIKLSGAKRLEQVDNLAAYARTCAMNLAFDWRRRENRLNTCSSDLIDPAADDTSVLSSLVDNEQFKAILDAAEKLSKLQRQVFVLRYIEQRSFDQIAAETEKTPHHVRALASRSLARVRQICSKVQVKFDAGGRS